ncbi:hypothetical protein HO173_007857 [Letharia columbiana]|uniref:Mitochondrial division protein 1 n=1 Tax=Letharia columbiana TaxID=112416 RepID=A0A8H6L3C6_9LECA|nr:uncharacterized protein HO173_007857 [Letharia columbiana]KAF6234027.1 hypothetical protein HO173_007857 [Letharia columbiana]
MFLGGLPMSASLADLGFEALSLFQRVQTVNSDKTSQDWPAASFTAEAERFELWAVNLGLFVVGHGSLDYRVREADRLAQTIRRFLQELMDSLAEVIQMRIGGGDEQSPDDDNNDDNDDNDDGSGDDDDDPEAEESDSEPSSDDDTEESDLDLLLDGVRDPIDRLYKVSTKIRNPSSRLGSSRATNHQQIDEETGVDFLRAIEQADYEHIRSLFLQYQKARALQERDTVEPTKDTHGAADFFLIRRVARANVRRRQQFAYRKMHREKLARQARASISTQSVFTPGTEIPSQPSFDRHVSNSSFIPQAELAPPAASVTTATNLNLARLELVDNQSMFTVSEYAPSTWQPARDAVAFPPAPTTQSGEKFFECPYCFTFCSRGALAAKAWKAHLIHDLSPYICTYEDCRNPDQLYDDRHDWAHHENSCHRKVWRCPEHSGQVFTLLGTYREHLRNEHTDYGDDASANRIIRASESIMTATDRPCPVCSIVFDTPRALQNHIALHLERFSLFSLPRSVACGGDDDDDVADADSDKANGTIEDSRDEDFEGDLDIKSENTGGEVEEGGEASEAPESKIEVAEEPPTHPIRKHLRNKVNVAVEAKSAESEDNLVVTGTTVNVFEDHNTPVYMVAFSLDDKLLASVSDDKVVRLWDLESEAAPTPLKGHKSGFRSLAWSHDGRTIASGSYDKTTKLWDVSTNTCLHTLPGHGGAVSGLSFSSDDKLLASASHDKTCKLWDVSTGTARFTLEGHTAGVFSIGISPNDKYIVSGSNDRTVKIWDLATGALLRTLKGHGRVIYALAFTPDSQILATAGNDWIIKLWDLGSGMLLRSIKSHEKGITALAFSPDGSLMASGSYDHMIKIWETTTWTNVGVLRGHSADVYGVAFSRDGQRIASGSRDRVVRLWDLSLERRALPVD